MFHVISDIVMSIDMFGCREMFRIRDAMANFVWQMVRMHIQVWLERWQELVSFPTS